MNFMIRKNPKSPVMWGGVGGGRKRIDIGVNQKGIGGQ